MLIGFWSFARYDNNKHAKWNKQKGKQKQKIPTTNRKAGNLTIIFHF